MRNNFFFLIITMMVSGCAVENFDPNKHSINRFSEVMPRQYEKLTKSQRAAIMSGERPDWGSGYEGYSHFRW